MPQVHQPGRVVHRGPEIVTTSFRYLAGVQAHPDPDRGGIRPLLRGQTCLGFYPCGHCVAGAPERRREPIAAGGKDVATVRLDRPP
jgi:hypothetical protein